jgi:multiple sugar transport system substrate-binding protein
MKKMTRRSFLHGAAATAALPLVSGLPTRATAQQAEPKPFAGKTLNVFMFDHPYPRALKDLLPQFTERTGIKVEMETPSFIVYNQRADLELSTGSGAFDVMSMTFIFSGKWIGAGWASKLNDFISKDPGLDVADFLPGAMASMKGGNDIMAMPFVAESTLMVYRTDVLKRAGVKPQQLHEVPHRGGAVYEAPHRRPCHDRPSPHQRTHSGGSGSGPLGAAPQADGLRQWDVRRV